MIIEGTVQPAGSVIETPVNSSWTDPVADPAVVSTVLSVTFTAFHPMEYFCPKTVVSNVQVLVVVVLIF